jgi:hypothetical protein
MCAITSSIFLVYIILLYIIILIYITKAANVTIDNKINDLLFTDNKVLIVKDEKLLQHDINNLRNECSNNNMKSIVQKTEVMIIGRMKQSSSISLDNTELKQVSEFKYLGITFTDT